MRIKDSQKNKQFQKSKLNKIAKDSQSIFDREIEKLQTLTSSKRKRSYDAIDETEESSEHQMRFNIKNRLHKIR
ncbi:unnamed protein product, partial [Brachionus calyciflorus]